MEKPKKLYRGIHVDLEQFAKLDLDGDILPISGSKYNEDGRAVVGDGNEYGIYMTSNIIMALDAYGNVHNSGKPYKKEIQYYDDNCKRMVPVYTPNIGITYEIDTDKIAVKKPWICSALEGHYNNGFGGEEWITDTEHKIPSECYQIIRLIVGYDTLNDSETMDIKNLNSLEMKKKVIDIVAERKKGYDLFLEQVEKNPQKIRAISRLNIMKRLFNGKSGVALNEVLEEDIRNDPNKIVNFLMRKVYLLNPKELDFETLDYLYGKSRRNIDSIENFVEELQNDLAMFSERKKHFESEGKINNVFSKRVDMVKSFLESIKGLNVSGKQFE